ncbi:hypothetical protein PG993_011827 [Apiospora rasikravindrae]|uniref:DUF397 domain-containing protein n=1 Tax=Apiospora rasikravindrae TaxID=990691 RepID=A0ABR1S0Q6_9PEZI
MARPQAPVCSADVHRNGGAAVCLESGQAVARNRHAKAPIIAPPYIPLDGPGADLASGFLRRRLLGVTQ